MRQKEHMTRLSGALPAGLVMVCFFYFPASPVRAEVAKAARSQGATAHAAGAAPGVSAAGAYGALPIRFETNVGQAGAGAQFVARGAGYGLFLSPTGTTLVLDGGRAPGAPRPATSLRMRLVGSNPEASTEGVDRLPGRSNYLLGADPAHWRRDVPAYSKIRYANVYPGVDLVYYGNAGDLEYDFVLAPGTDPTCISLAFDGAERVDVSPEGDLVLHTPGGSLRQKAPVIYQPSGAAKRMVSGRYAARGPREIGFDVAGYDVSAPLVVDPVLVYSTYLGGSLADRGHDIAVDTAGNAYVTGFTASLDFPTENALQTDPNGPGIDFADVFVAKLSPDGSSLVYSTYLGGASFDSGSGIAVDDAGNAYIAGYTSSTDFPTRNPIQGTAAGGGYDGFVAKLSPDGSELVYSTYLGGGSGSGLDWDVCKDIAVDGQRSAYVVGDTNSPFFPTRNPVQAEPGGPGFDAFVARLNPAGDELVYSTYLGGAGYDIGSNIAVDAGGRAYFTGETQSPDFPTERPIQDAFRGLSDVFVAALSPEGSSLYFSTFLGGEADDEVGGIALDHEGHVFVSGGTESLDFPVVRSIYTPTPEPPGMPQPFVAFASKLDPEAQTLDYSTFLPAGGGRDTDIAVNAAGEAYLAAVSVPAGESAVARRPDPGVTKLNAEGSAISYATRFGGRRYDYVQAIAVDAAGDVYLTGFTDSPDLPVAKAAQPDFAGEQDAFVAKVSPVAVAPPVVRGIEGIATIARPLRIRITGENFQSGVQVFVGHDREPWPSTTRKSDTRIVLRGTEALAERFPIGRPVLVRVVNPDGGETFVSFTRQEP
jgi:hypothetical protein